MKLRISLHQYKNANQVPYAIDQASVAFRGSNSLVQKAASRRTRELYAVKSVSDPDSVRMEREIKILKLCHHPNVISLAEAYQISGDGTVYLVTSPWAPYTVYDFISQSDPKRVSSCPWFAINIPQSDRYILDIFVGIARGVEYLQSLSIKRKDLKPDNILLHQPNPFTIQPIVADVGHSKIFKLGDPTDFIHGTRSYLAPEQLDKVESSFRSDIWQLGCCFAMILVVSRGGRAAEQDLWDSFSDAGCIIAEERDSFMRTFEGICGHGRPAQRLTWQLITMMLEINPSTRISIDNVLIRLNAVISL
ncbi:kinase-like domain-containing protein, partial [Xylariaceae sp. AK1471]